MGEGLRYSPRDKVGSYEDWRAETTKTLKGEIEHGTQKWQNYDSPLLDHADRLPISFDEYFRFVLPSGVSMREHVMERLQDRGRHATGVEFGGVGSRLFSGFPRGFFERSLGVTLLDHRTESAINYDTQRGHSVIASDPQEVKQLLAGSQSQPEVLGDLTTVQTREAVERWLAGRKVDLIVERLMGPLLHVPRDPYFMARYISDWYRKLSDGGIMFIQVPAFMDPLLKLWEERVKVESGGRIELQTAGGGYKFDARFRLEKKSGAPEEIPLLMPEDVRRAYTLRKNLSIAQRILARLGLDPRSL